MKGFVDDYNNIKNEKVLRFNTQKMRCVIGKEIKLKYRMVDRKTFFTKDIVFPLMVTETAMVLDNWLFNNINRNVRRIKKIFPSCLALIVCEVVRNDYSADVSDSSIDGVYIFQKQTINMKRKKISYDVISALLKHIENHFQKGEREFQEKIEKGIILK